MVIDPEAGVKAIKVTSVHFHMDKTTLVCRINHTKMQVRDDEFDYYKDCFMDQTLYITPKDPENRITYYKFQSLDDLNCSHIQYHLE